MGITGFGICRIDIDLWSGDFSSALLGFDGNLTILCTLAEVVGANRDFT